MKWYVKYDNEVQIVNEVKPEFFEHDGLLLEMIPDEVANHIDNLQSIIKQLSQSLENSKIDLLYNEYEQNHENEDFIEEYGEFASFQDFLAMYGN